MRSARCEPVRDRGSSTTTFSGSAPSQNQGGGASCALASVRALKPAPNSCLWSLHPPHLCPGPISEARPTRRAVRATSTSACVRQRVPALSRGGPAFPPRPHPNVRADVTTAPSRTEAGFFSAPFFLRRKRLAGGERMRRDKLPRVQCRQWNREMRRRGCRCVGFYPSLVSHYGFFCGFDHAVTFGCSPAGIG